MYMSFFGTIQYDNQFLVDLSKKITSIEVDDPKFLYDQYVVQDGERPDSVSNKFYGVPYYHWVILVTNGLTLKTWQLSDRAQALRWDFKYGGIPRSVHHFETQDGLITPPEFPVSIETPDGTVDYYFNGDGLGTVVNNKVQGLGQPVSTYDWEIAQNDSRKTIRILDKRHLPDITTLATELLASR